MILRPMALGYEISGFGRGFLRVERFRFTELGLSHAGVHFSFSRNGELETRSQLLKGRQGFSLDLVRTRVGGGRFRADGFRHYRFSGL